MCLAELLHGAHGPELLSLCVLRHGETLCSAVAAMAVVSGCRCGMAVRVEVVV